jgi:hypothetical protein
MVVFFGLGILNKEDFNNFLWTIIILAAGGLALGKAVNSSGLLRTIAVSITSRVEGLGLYSVLVVFAALIGVVATFISHTVAALIVLPLVQQVGESMADPHPNLLVMGSVLMASAAMGLPTSGFPNMSKFTCLYGLHVKNANIRHHSCNHDGRTKHWQTLPPGQAFHYPRCTCIHHGLRCHYHSWIWTDVGCWILSRIGIKC